MKLDKGPFNSNKYLVHVKTKGNVKKTKEIGEDYRENPKTKKPPKSKKSPKTKKPPKTLDTAKDGSFKNMKECMKFVWLPTKSNRESIRKQCNGIIRLDIMAKMTKDTQKTLKEKLKL